MAARPNPNFNNLRPGDYLFTRMAKETAVWKAANPGVRLLSLGIGDTSGPLVPSVIKGMNRAVKRQSKQRSYTGYGDATGHESLKKKIVERYARLGVKVDISEIFISDGAKGDTANITKIFHPKSRIAVEDPAYPVYLDANVINGMVGKFNEKTGEFARVHYMRLLKKNGFVPEPPPIKKKIDIIFICRPNNPTGAVFTREDWETFLNYCELTGARLIVDSAYAIFIDDDGIPKSPLEISGAEKYIIEICSFSKDHAFTGERIGFTTISHKFTLEGTAEGEVAEKYWKRYKDTFTNGPANIAQCGAEAGSTVEGMLESWELLISPVKENFADIASTLSEMGFPVYGSAPYAWVDVSPYGSWEFQYKVRDEAHVICTPGEGFGRSGRRYARFSAFGTRRDVKTALKSVKENLALNV
ncbi:LL-diaminopimelate aminotransferase [candidate division WS5 bacterium]|uniref:Aminotransferase n=1 Tax=candidate division WS5 bacterium TaxID=2093353 RepID=A0A419DE36_9BACT|nr:MAG: LL-diaminopimelate aminotransferase [candidate division WS5 bacterium]